MRTTRTRSSAGRRRLPVPRRHRLAVNNLGCLVVVDNLAAAERVRRLPCTHLYHDGCILPWLAIRDSCPVCRHELPSTDDPEPEYEKWNARLHALDMITVVEVGLL
ncbi:unnamed protein product [Urochloa humidicola]